MTNQKDPKYTIGYGKPPKHTRFKPGQSGNPIGRPKKSKTFEDDIEAELGSSVTIVEGEERRRISKRRAIVKQHANRAMKGDVKSTALLFKYGRPNKSDQQDNLGSLLDEFREKNRRISADETAKKSTSNGDKE